MGQAGLRERNRDDGTVGGSRMAWDGDVKLLSDSCDGWLTSALHIRRNPRVVVCGRCHRRVPRYLAVWPSETRNATRAGGTSVYGGGWWCITCFRKWFVRDGRKLFGLTKREATVAVWIPGDAHPDCEFCRRHGTCTLHGTGHTHWGRTRYNARVCLECRHWRFERRLAQR